nr:hypothetical protein [Roseomonas sp. NPKOSM-4]
MFSALRVSTARVAAAAVSASGVGVGGEKPRAISSRFTKRSVPATLLR